MNEKIETAEDGAYVIRGLSSCEIQGFSTCHRDGWCSSCKIALTHLNPDTPLDELMKKVSL